MMPSIKRISAVLLAVSFFLPLAQCSQKVGEKSAPVTVTASNTYEGLTLLSILFLVVFFWPLALQLWRTIKRVRVTTRNASWMEFGLSVLSLAGVTWLVVPPLNAGASVRYGAFVAYASLLAYGAVSLVEGMTSRPDGRQMPFGNAQTRD
jgi:hypothetical protein